MNLYTVSKATRGLGRYLLETCEKPSCAVSCDSRIHSRDFAELTAATLAEMGIRVYLYRTLMPTPHAVLRGAPPAHQRGRDGDGEP